LIAALVRFAETNRAGAVLFRRASKLDSDHR